MELYELHPGSPQPLLDRGNLREVVRICAATTIMHYTNRYDEGELLAACERLRVTWHKVCGSNGAWTNSAERIAHTALEQWSRIIRAEFDADNLWITAQSLTDPSDVKSILNALESRDAAIEQLQKQNKLLLQKQAEDQEDRLRFQSTVESWMTTQQGSGTNLAQSSGGFGDLPASASLSSRAARPAAAAASASAAAAAQGE